MPDGHQCPTLLGSSDLKGETAMDKLTIVSVDGHAQIPQDAWPDYLE
jgi:hypothetical protein